MLQQSIDVALDRQTSGQKRLLGMQATLPQCLGCGDVLSQDHVSALGGILVALN